MSFLGACCSRMSQSVSQPPPEHPATTRLRRRKDYAQRTPEWFAIRQGLLTASDAASALDIKPYASYRGSSRAELLRKKVSNAPLNNMFVVHGQKYEDEARSWACAAMGEEAHDIGLVVHDTHAWLAASPDGVTRSGKLMEIKCPLKRTIEPGQIPHHYYPQVQVQMEVCDIDQTIFVQYKPSAITRDGRAFIDIVVVERDRRWFENNKDGLKRFWEEYMEERQKPRVDEQEPPQNPCRIRDDMYPEEPPKQPRIC